MSAPLAYHITWTAYGTWLHGDSRGWVESGVPCIQPPDEARLRLALLQMAQAPVTFDEEQRALIEGVITEHCRIRDWQIHALNARSNHVHVVVTADREPEEVMTTKSMVFSSPVGRGGFARLNPGEESGPAEVVHGTRQYKVDQRRGVS